MLTSGELAGEGCFITDLNRISRVGIHYPMILDEHAGNTVGCSRNDEGVVEADLRWPRLDLTVPIDIAATQTKVPLAHDAGLIPGFLEHAWNGQLLPADNQTG